MTNGVLKTYTYRFVADTSDLKKAFEQADKGGKSLEKTNTNVTRANEKTTRSLLRLGKSVLGMGAAFFSAKALISNTFNVLQDAVGRVKLAEYLEENVNGMNAYARAVERAGGTQKGFLTGISTLFDQLKQVEVLGAGAPILKVFTEAGIAARDAEGKLKGPIELLDEIITSFKERKFSAAEAQQLLGAIGFDPLTTLALLSQNFGKTLDDVLSKQRKITKDEDTRLKNLENQLKATQQAAGDLFLDIGLDSLEAAIDLLGTIEDILLRVRKVGIVGALAGAEEGTLPGDIKRALEGDAEAIKNLSGFIFDAAKTAAQYSPLGLAFEHGPGRPVYDFLSGGGISKQDAANLFQFDPNRGYFQQPVPAPARGPTSESAKGVIEFFQIMSLMDKVDKSPLNMPANPTQDNRQSSVNLRVDTLNVNTQATSARGIAASVVQAIEEKLQDEYAGTIASSDNSVIA